jgi:hypothetical protein
VRVHAVECDLPVSSREASEGNGRGQMFERDIANSFL